MHAQANEWLDAQGRVVANIDLFYQLYEEVLACEMIGVDVLFWHIRREVNTFRIFILQSLTLLPQRNNVADKLARLAVSSSIEEARQLREVNSVCACVHAMLQC
jgi:hypothetical protein